MSKTKKANRRWKKIGLTALLPLLMVFSAYKLDYFEINKQLDIFANLFREVNMIYVDDTDPAKLMDKAIESMLKELDPYTTYMRESDVEEFRIQTTGLYGGIGSTIRKVGDRVLIIQPYKNYPADKAGLKAGDRILTIDGTGMNGKSTDEVSRLLKGSPGTEVEIEIERDGEQMTKTLKREEIKMNSVPYYGMVDDKIGYIILSSFTPTASQEVSDALKALKKDNDLKGVILDLRNNPGGLLNEAVNVANIFIEKGQEVVSTRGKIKEVENSYRTTRTPDDMEVPLAVLLNSGSASASEIVAGTIQDLDRGVVLGTRSFGKGLVQQSRQLSYGAQAKITIAKYYTPSGRCIQAINYAERNEDGSVSKVPDSLRTAFKTQNGRTVYDGGGIDPDINIEQPRLANILFSLVQQNLIFDYATKYVRKYPTVAPPRQFRLSDAEYEEFLNFLEDKNYNYTTDTEEMLAELAQAAKDEEYEQIIPEIIRLKEEYHAVKQKDLVNFKNQIRRVLEEEIIARYYYQEGRLEHSKSEDPVIVRSVEVLRDQNGYRQILTNATAKK